MPQLVTVKESIDKDDRQPGDVLGIWPDDKKFTERELAENTITQITEAKAQEYYATKPKVRKAFKALTTDWTLEMPSVTEVYEDNGQWLELKERAFRSVQYIDGAFVNKIAEKETNKTVLIPKAEK